MNPLESSDENNSVVDDCDRHLFQPIHIYQLLETLQMAHQRKIVHRNVRLANILWVSNSEVLLNDWGTAYDFTDNYGNDYDEYTGCVKEASPNALNDMIQNTNTPKCSDDLHSLVRAFYRMTHNNKPQTSDINELQSFWTAVYNTEEQWRMLMDMAEELNYKGMENAITTKGTNYHSHKHMYKVISTTKQKPTTTQ